MLKLAARRAYFAALAVPVAMVIAPLTASAGVPDEAVVAQQEEAHAVVTGWHEPANVDVVCDEDDTNVTYVINGIHHDSVTGNHEEEAGDDDEDAYFSPGPDWYYDDDVAYEDSDDVNVTYVVNGIYDDSVTGNHEEEAGDDDEVAYLDGDVDADDDDVAVIADAVHDMDKWSDDDTASGASYEDATAYAGSGGAYVDSVESDSFSQHDNDFGYAFGDDDTAGGASYEDVTTAAGSGGAWVDSVEADSFSQQDNDFGYMFDDDDFTAGSFEDMTTGAGNGGAFADNVESGFMAQD